ncbi:MAG TPA: hypothetical protein VNB90_13185 [Cytophagaceae bacterium]|nr:hypothetical protein [Cytophagaceae bacterium]
MNNQVNNAFTFFKLFIALAYIAIGIMLIVQPDSLSALISAKYAPYLGVVVILYGLFRGYRTYTTERKK